MLLYCPHFCVNISVYLTVVAYYDFLALFTVHYHVCFKVFAVYIALSSYHIIIVADMLYLSKKLVASVLFDVHCFSCYLCIQQPTSLNVVYNIKGESRLMGCLHDPANFQQMYSKYMC